MPNITQVQPSRGLLNAKQHTQKPIIPSQKASDPAALGWLIDLSQEGDTTQNQEQTQDMSIGSNSIGSNTDGTLLLKLSEIEDKNVYVLAEKVEILYGNSEATQEGTSEADVVNVVTTVTNLVTALVGLLAALLSYKNTQKSKSKKSNDLFTEEGNEPPLVQITIHNHAIAIADFETPAALASSIFR